MRSNKKVGASMRLMHEISEMMRDLTGRPSRVAPENKTTIAQIRVISTVFRHAPESVMLKDIAGELKLTPGAISQTVDALVRDGMIERHRAEHDRRAVAIRVSKKAEKFRQHIEKESAKLMKGFLEDIPERDLSVFVRVLEILYERVKAAVQDKASNPTQRKG